MIMSSENVQMFVLFLQFFLFKHDGIVNVANTINNNLYKIGFLISREYCSIITPEVGPIS